jgi:hypothetical protein
MLERLRKLLRRLLLRRPPLEPQDPYAEVTAPLKPRRPRLSGSVALAEPDNE